MPLVSYGAWPGDQGRFYSREAEPRVPASRRDAATARRGEEKRGGGRGDERRREERKLARRGQEWPVGDGKRGRER